MDYFVSSEIEVADADRQVAVLFIGHPRPAQTSCATTVRACVCVCFCDSSSRKDRPHHQLNARGPRMLDGAGWMVF